MHASSANAKNDLVSEYTINATDICQTNVRLS